MERNGEFHENEILELSSSDRFRSCHFYGCTFTGGISAVNAEFRNCIFVNCTGVTGSYFRDCLFQTGDEE